MSDPKATRFESFYSHNAGSPLLSSTAAYTAAAYHTQSAYHSRAISTSPSRREVIHTGEPIVERVVEQINMCTPELMARAAAAKTEAESLRVRMTQYELLVSQHSELHAKYSDQCQENYRIRTDFEGKHAANSVEIHQNSNELHQTTCRVENTRRHITLLTEIHAKNVTNISTADAELIKVREQLVLLAADRATMDTRHAEQVTEIRENDEANMKTSKELHEQHVLNNQKNKELHDLQIQVRCMESQSECLLRRIDDLQLCLDTRTKDHETYEARLAELGPEIESLVVKISATQAQITTITGMIEVQVKANTTLTTQIHETSVQNCEASANINDLSVRCTAIESRIACMKNEVECLKQSNGCFLDQNSDLQAQVTTMKGHNGVVTTQNMTFSNELQSFVSANEAMRVQLDRRHRVLQTCARNEESVAFSSNEVHRSRSPVRRVHSSLIVESPLPFYHAPAPVQVYHHAPAPLPLAPLHGYSYGLGGGYGGSFHHQKSYSSFYGASSPLPYEPKTPVKVVTKDESPVVVAEKKEEQIIS